MSLKVKAVSKDENECGVANTKMPTAIGDRVLNGMDIERGEWPWLVYVSISTKKANGACTATIISKRHLLTASHCLNGLLQDGKGVIKAVVGRINVNGTFGKGKTVIRAIVHPSVRKLDEDGRRQFQLGADIAILTLKEPLKFGPMVRKVCLASDFKEDVGEVAFTAGWGYQQNVAKEDYHGTAQETQIPFDSSQKCVDWAKAFDAKTKFLPEYFLCGGSYGRGTETGDSGGPVTQNVNGKWFQVGVTSYGEYQHNKKGRLFDVGAYARVSKACDWIERETEGEAKCISMKSAKGISAQKSLKNN
uniref:Peptidase S1 domain-containing protein n=1 Tax=Ditylenchus dipsaci TaxID=166011 RepID=A0A915EQ88_9BILA